MPPRTTTGIESVPNTMRAWTYTEPGLPSTALQFTKTHPISHNLSPNQVLVKISHCGFNAGVTTIMQIVPSWLHKTPAIPEIDFSGEIVAASTLSRTDLHIGTKVFGSCPPPLHFRYGRGTLAEYVVVPVDTISPVPSNMSMEQAGALSGCGCTAVQLVRRAKIKKGDSVFINGGSGGLGSIVVQVVKAAVGASGQVVATCSGPKLDFVRGLGADEVCAALCCTILLSVVCLLYKTTDMSPPQVIDYTAHPSLSTHLSQTYSSARFDTVIDNVGIQSLYTSSPSYLTERGVFINAGGMNVVPSFLSFFGLLWMMLLNHIYPSFLPNGVPRSYAFLSGYANEADLAEVKGLVEEGKLTVPIDSVWGMEEALKGYERIESKRARGKVVVRTQEM